MATTEIHLDIDRSALLERLVETRSRTEQLSSVLAPEDQVIQSMPDVSPTKWHRAHTTWFFETFVLAPHVPGFKPVHPRFDYLFNSYYEQVGPRHPRAERGLISRPTVAEVADYRSQVDDRLTHFLAGADDGTWNTVAPLVELGINHEEQHQELLLMDIKHVLSCNPIKPAYAAYEGQPSAPQAQGRLRWLEVEAGGLVEIGHHGPRFAFDNEGPRHRTFLEPFRIADRLVSCGEWMAFIDDGGYRRPELWLSDGWATVKDQRWEAPLYWDLDRGELFTLRGMAPIESDSPVCHVSYFEADAYARWAGARLPSEVDWEVATRLLGAGEEPNDLATGALQPRPPTAAGGLRQAAGDVWEWTCSPYGAYPGFRPVPGAIGEYNGKFMCNQMVLRGGSCVTPRGHTRTTYRNFFPPSARWAFSGLRLAADAF